ncbi:MAG TPA: hypothetical protein VM492_16350 [Sumerlaeia bacterium]|nr:hypothetical protein [Sumerlaeia bacterium]
MAPSEQEESPFDIQLDIDEVSQVLPGYAGFGHPDERRASDEALRAHLVDALRDLLRHLVSLEVHLSRVGPVHLHERLRGVQGEIETLFDRIQAAPYSFSPLFTFETLPEDVQRTMLRCDREVIGAAKRAYELLEITLTPGSDFGAVVDSAKQAAASLDAALEQRLSAIMEVN